MCYEKYNVYFCKVFEQQNYVHVLWLYLVRLHYMDGHRNEASYLHVKQLRMSAEIGFCPQQQASHTTVHCTMGQGQGEAGQKL